MMSLAFLLIFAFGVLVGAALVAVGMRVMLAIEAQERANRERLLATLQHTIIAEQPTQRLPRLMMPMGFQRPRKAA